MVSKRTLSISIVVLCGVLLTAHGFQRNSNKRCCLSYMNSYERSKEVSPGNCTDITITYTIFNNLTNTQNFDYSIRVRHPQDVFIRFMEAVTFEHRNFQFSVEYDQNEHKITSINNLKADRENNKTWWKLIRMPSETLTVGVNRFIPEHEDHIMFKYVKEN